MEEKKQEEQTKKILYIGQDESFFQQLKEKFGFTYKYYNAEFEKDFSEDEVEIQSFILKIKEMRPRLVILDLSENVEAYLHLSRIWTRYNFHLKIRIMGVTPAEKNNNLLKRAVSAGMSAVHVKSQDLYSLMYTIIALGFNDQLENHIFAKAKLSDTVNSYYPCQVNMISDGFIQVESNVHGEHGKEFRLLNHWSENSIINSHYVTLMSQSNKGLYYNYTYSQRYEFLHADILPDPATVAPNEYEELSQRRDGIIGSSKHRAKKWASDNTVDSSPKFFKLYVVDKEAKFYDEQKLTDKYPFVLRSQPYMENADKELSALRPNMIIYNLEDLDKEELEGLSDIAFMFNDTRMLQHLVKKTKQYLPDIKPMIVVFNAPNHDTEYLQKVLNYKNIVSFKEQLSTEAVVKMTELYYKRIEKDLPKITRGEIFVKKEHPGSYAELESQIQLISCSENDIYFNTTDELEDDTVIKVNSPVQMYFTICKPPRTSRIQSQYYGVLHSINEEDKKELRRYINSVFFRGLDLSKAKDREEMEQIKNDYLKRKQQEEEEHARKIKEAALGLDSRDLDETSN